MNKCIVPNSTEMCIQLACTCDTRPSRITCRKLYSCLTRTDRQRQYDTMCVNTMWPLQLPIAVFVARLNKMFHFYCFRLKCMGCMIFGNVECTNRDTTNACFFCYNHRLRAGRDARRQDSIERNATRMGRPSQMAFEQPSLKYSITKDTIYSFLQHRFISKNHFSRSHTLMWHPFFWPTTHMYFGIDLQPTSLVSIESWCRTLNVILNRVRPVFQHLKSEQEKWQN